MVQTVLTVSLVSYTKKNNNKHEVATTDDGLKFTGNNTDVVNKTNWIALLKFKVKA